MVKKSDRKSAPSAVRAPRKTAPERKREALVKAVVEVCGRVPDFSPDELRAVAILASERGEAPAVEEVRDPRSRAVRLVALAFEEGDDRRARGRVDRALGLDPDCLEAHVWLANRARALEEACGHLRRAVAGGERRLGADFFREHAGDFWGLLETRTYMSARRDLALLLWCADRRDEALAHERELLRLNPNDNQGVRDGFLHGLLIAGRFDEARALLETYDEVSAPHCWGRFLLGLLSGESDEALVRQFKEATGANPHVFDFLLRMRKLPGREPDGYTRGSRDEAAAYLMMARGWEAWMREEPVNRLHAFSERLGPMLDALEEKAEDEGPGGGETPLLPFHQTGAPGRNGPCPCGSGKKFKNCCGG
jgi:tetratricopeptide (TPR) repeat protein